MPPTENGRITLGDETNANVPAEWAPELLRILWREQRAAVGAAIGEVVTGTRYTARRAPRTAELLEDEQ